jgi:hypothetical protein
MTLSKILKEHNQSDLAKTLNIKINANTIEEELLKRNILVEKEVKVTKIEFADTEEAKNYGNGKERKTYNKETILKLAKDLETEKINQIRNKMEQQIKTNE